MTEKQLRAWTRQEADEHMEEGRRIHAAVEEAYQQVETSVPFPEGQKTLKTRDGDDIDPNSLYHKLLLKVGKSHEQVQAGLSAEREERARLAAHEATRPKPELQENVSKHFFIESLIELCEKHNLFISLGVYASIEELEDGDLDDLRALDPILNPPAPPPSKRPYR